MRVVCNYALRDCADRLNAVKFSQFSGYLRLTGREDVTTINFIKRNSERLSLSS